MTKLATALAAALIAGTAMTSTAQAGFRVGFGLPLGAFVAHSLMSEANRQSQYDRRPARHSYAKPAYSKKAAKPVVAQSRPAKPKIEKVAKVEKVHKIEKKRVIVAASPAPRVDTLVKAAPVATAAVATPAADKPVISPATSELVELKAIEATALQAQTIAPPAVTIAETTTAENTVTISNTVKPVCRRYSAAIAAMIEVPCE